MKSRLISINNKDILMFLDQAETLYRCDFLQHPPKIKVGIGLTEKGGIKFSGNMPDRDIVEPFLMRIRPFIEYEERLHLGRVISFLLNKYGESKFLADLQELFQGKSEHQYPAVTIDSKQYFIRDMLNLYLYGKYFHLDKEKQKIQYAIEQVFGPLAEFYALSQLEKYAGIVLGVAGYIRKNKLFKNEAK